MYLMSSTLLFLLSIIVGISIIMSCSSLLVAWVGLELGVLSFIPLILFKKELKSSESALKYFLSQTLGSIVILLSVGGSLLMPFSFWDGLLIMSVALKMGGTPFHAWVPSVCSQMNWNSFYLLLTLQKIPPLLILCSYLNWETNLIISISVMSLIVGGIVGLIQVQTRKLLAYSSINQVGWLFGSSLFGLHLVVMFFASYCLILLSLVMVLRSFNLNLLKQISNTNSNLCLLFLGVNFLSLGGLPPFLGFFPKWMVLSFMVQFSVLLSLIMVLMSLVVLYFYLRLTLSSFMFTSVGWNLNNSNDMSSSLFMFLTSASFFGLPLMMFIW